MDINLKIKVESPELINALLAFAEVIPQLQQKSTNDGEVKVVLEKPKEEAKPKKEIKLEDVRAKLAELSRQGKQPEVKALISKFGANKLTDIDESCYEELLKEAEAL